MPKPPDFEFKDRRRLRGESSKKAIVQAALALLEEGTLQPTIQQIAQRAGVGTRTYFRHFGDDDSLFVEVNKEIYESSARLFAGGDRSGPLEKRVAACISHRSEAYEQVGNLILSTQVMFWNSSILRENLARAQADMRSDLEDWLPELRTLSPEKREAIEAITSFDCWHRLRAYQQLTKDRAVSALVTMVNQTLGQ